MCGSAWRPLQGGVRKKGTDAEVGVAFGVVKATPGAADVVEAVGPAVDVAELVGRRVPGVQLAGAAEDVQQGGGLAAVKVACRGPSAAL